jgi:glutathione synthase/RimK-type ligase-like ATP-grasp enzyme
MEFRIEIRNDGIWITSEFRLTICSLDFLQFQYGSWFIEINVKPNVEDEFEDILFIRIINDGKRLFIGDYEITETTTISNNHYSIYFEKLD